MSSKPNAANWSADPRRVLKFKQDDPWTSSGGSCESPGGSTIPSSHGPSLRLTVPKRHYSMYRNDSLQLVDIPVFDKAVQLRKDTPSSQVTVLTVAGLFVVGILLIVSGCIVLFEQNERPFVIAGCLFLTIGLLMLLSCAMLQRKNILKFLLDLNQDLYFLNMSDSYMYKLMFVDQTELPEQA